MTTISIDVHVEDVLPELSDSDLLDELKSRGFSGPKDDLLDLVREMRQTFAERNGLHFEVLMCRLLTLAGVPRQKLVKAKEPAQ